MTTPERQDYDSVLRDLQLRLQRLEKAQRNPALALPNSSVTPASPSAGGLFYVSGGVLHYIGSSGTNTTIAPA